MTETISPYCLSGWTTLSQWRPPINATI
jgi:hypothetical protein